MHMTQNSKGTKKVYNKSCLLSVLTPVLQSPSPISCVSFQKQNSEYRGPISFPTKIYHIVPSIQIGGRLPLPVVLQKGLDSRAPTLQILIQQVKPRPGVAGGGEGGKKGERGRVGEGQRERGRLYVLVLNSIDALICSQGQKVMENRSLPLGFFHFSPTGTKLNSKSYLPLKRLLIPHFYFQ